MVVAQVTVVVVGVLLLDAVVVDMVAVDQAVVAMVTMMQGLQRSVLVLVMLISIDQVEVLAEDHQVVVADMVAVLVAEVVLVVVVVEVVDLCKNSQATSNICILRQIWRQQKSLQRMRFS